MLLLYNKLDLGRVNLQQAWELREGWVSDTCYAWAIILNFEWPDPNLEVLQETNG